MSGDRGRTPDYSPSTTRRGLLAGAAQDHDHTTRRNLLRGGTVIAVAGAVAAVPTLLTPPRAEPIVAGVAAHAEPASDPAIIERHGERLAVWERREPARHAELKRLIAESDRLTQLMTDLIEEMMVSPATTLAGINAKLTISLELWPSDPRNNPHSNWTEDVAFAFMQDATRLLNGALT